jgi:hypothetical protein
MIAKHDAAYIVLAEKLDAALITRDARLASASGHAAPIELFYAAIKRGIRSRGVCRVLPLGFNTFAADFRLVARSSRGVLSAVVETPFRNAPSSNLTVILSASVIK